MNVKSLLLPISVLFWSACSSVTSTMVSKDYVDGLTYYMPKKDFVVTIIMAKPDNSGKNEVSNVVFSQSKAYADREIQYILAPQTNLLNDNKLNVSISEIGLLKTSIVNSTSKVSEVFEGIAQIAGYQAFIQTKEKCKKAGSYIFIYDLSKKKKEDKQCGVKITIKSLSNTSASTKNHKTKNDTGYTGIFYRQEIAYKITATTDEGDIHKEAILHSPSESKTLFLPVSRSFFADSEAKFTFIDGIPTIYSQNDESELVGAFSIPAKIIGSYFKAAGELFSSFNTKNSNESALIKSNSTLELEKYNAQRDLELSKIESNYKFKILELKVKACESAIANNDQKLIDSLSCIK